MKREKYLSVLLTLVMILSLMAAFSPAASADGTVTLPATMSYTANLGTGAVGMDGYTYRPYAISWTLGGNPGQYRAGYIAFNAKDLNIGEGEKIDSATLNLTVSRTQNVHDVGVTTITVYATDYSQIKLEGGTPGMPERRAKVGAIVMPPDMPKQDRNLQRPVSAELDLSTYFELFPGSQGIGLYLTNRDDDPECNSFGLVGFYGYDEGDNAPKLTINVAKIASATLTYKAGDTILGSRELTDLTVGKSYTLTEEEAPKIIKQDGKIYVRKNVNEDVVIETKEVVNEFVIEYDEVTVQSASVKDVHLYYWGKVKLPSRALVTFTNGESLSFPVDWDEDEIAEAEGKLGSSTIHGIISELFDYGVTCNVTVEEFIPNESVLTNSGGWNWYVEPSGTHIQPNDNLATRFETSYATNNGYKFKHDRTYMGWVQDDGTVVVAQYDHETGEYKRVVLHEKLEPDDHNNPAVIILPDGRIMAWYSMHTNEPYMYYRVSKNPEDISEWHEEQYYYCQTNTDGTYATYNATYPTAFVVNQGGAAGTDTIYLFWRGVHWQPTIAQFTVPDENGKCQVVMGQTQIVNAARSDSGKQSGSEGTLRPYAKYDYDYERGKIHMTFTYTHPDNAAQNPIYYLYINIADQGIYTANGIRLQDIPVDNKASYNSGGANQRWGVVIDDLYKTYPEIVVFDPKDEARRGWTWDIKVNEAGEPCIVYSDITDQAPGVDESLPDSFLDTSEDRAHHYYYYARWDSSTAQWVNTFLTYGGKWFHENTSQEKCYSGGVTLDHNAPDANVIYLAKPTMGKYGNIFEIYRWESPDRGATWPDDMKEALTQNSKINNARPNVIYNYKQNPDGTHGPRLLWIRGEYRYWMNYMYKTGVMTDFAGIKPLDDPEMKVDAFLTDENGEITQLSTDAAGKELTAEFKLSNISIGDGRALVAVAHYSKDKKLKAIKTKEVLVPARSVPQIPVLGAPKGRTEGTYSTMGSEEIIENISYTPESIEEGDSISLFAWNVGINKMQPIISIPYSVSTEGSTYLVRDQISYDGTEALKLAEGEEWNGWKAAAIVENTSYTPSFGTNNYVAITRAPYSNTGIHLYHGTTSTKTGEEGGAGGVMVSHAIPELDEDYVIRFKIRWVNELSWSYPSTGYAGFLLSHGTPIGQADNGANPCAMQFRHVGQDGGTNGRRGYYITYLGTNFNSGATKTVIDYVSGTIGNNSDRLFEGAQFDVKIVVRPTTKTIQCYVNDGYRTGYFEQAYNSGADWDTLKINNITFNTGIGARGELFIDDFAVKLLGKEPEIVTPPTGEKLGIVSVTSTQDEPSYAIDGNTSTFWLASSTNADPTPELIADLGGVYTITKVGLQAAEYHKGKTLRYDIYLSENGQTWTRIWRGTSNTTAAMDYRNGQLKAARYVKVRSCGNTSDMTFSIAELEVWGVSADGGGI